MKKSIVAGKDRIGLDGRFGNPIRERAFREWELASALPILRVLVAILGLAFAAFSVPDYLVLGPGTPFALALILRLLFLGLALAISWRMRQEAPLRVLELELGLVTAGGIGIFALELFLYQGESPYLQSMSVMLMIVAAFLIPNRLVFSFTMTTALCILGTANILVAEPSLPDTELAGITADFFLCLGLATASSWRTGRARRLEFLRAEELQALSRTDLLTGLANRRAFEEELRDAISRCSRYGEAASLIMIDLDSFKDVNDQYGHEVGDSVLEEFAQRLSGALRLADRPARWGGEEFAVILPMTGLEEALELAERLRHVVQDRPYEDAGILSASFGVTAIRADDELGEAVLRADRALYTAKRRGKNRVESE